MEWLPEQPSTLRPCRPASLSTRATLASQTPSTLSASGVPWPIVARTAWIGIDKIGWLRAVTSSLWTSMATAVFRHQRRRPLHSQWRRAPSLPHLRPSSDAHFRTGWRYVKCIVYVAGFRPLRCQLLPPPNHGTTLTLPLVASKKVRSSSVLS